MLKLLCKSDFVKRKQHYKVCDQCAKDFLDAQTESCTRNRVDWDARQSREGGRFMFINLGLCEAHYDGLPDEIMEREGKLRYA